jgi:hypothetical protein
MPTYESTYVVRMITDADSEDEALEIQAEALSDIAYDWDFA